MPKNRPALSFALGLLFALLCLSFANAQTQYGDDFVYGDARVDAPELAPRGSYSVGVRTMDITNPDQLDILSYSETNQNPRYDRTMTLEVWYPAVVPEGEEEMTTYSDVLGTGPDNPERPNTPFTFAGRALRDAEPDAASAPYPLVIVSHGYPGSRVLMTYLTENLASKGYVVVAIDHTESTHGDKVGFASTLLNRPLDQLFVLEQMADMGAADSGSFLSGLVNADDTAIVGYSMGGYGALNAAGAGFSEAIVNAPFVPGGELAARQTGNYEVDPRIKAVVALAPWGGEAALASIGVPDLSFWDAEGLAGLEVPTMFIVGSEDDVAGYEGGVKSLFEGAVNAERYMLVFENARHNVAPNPVPAAAEARFEDYMHYAEPVWDRPRTNNIVQHFVTAFLGETLKGEDFEEYLDVVPVAAESVWSRNEDGSPAADNTYWPGFENRTALGLELYHESPPSQ